MLGKVGRKGAAKDEKRSIKMPEDQLGLRYTQHGRGFMYVVRCSGLLGSGRERIEMLSRRSV